MVCINGLYDAQFYQWPFKHGDNVKLTEDFNGRSSGSVGIVDLRNRKYFWVTWKDGSYSSFSKLQMKYLKLKNY